MDEHHDFKKYFSYFLIAIISSLITAGIFVGFAPQLLKLSFARELQAQVSPDTPKTIYTVNDSNSNSIINARQKVAKAVVYIDTVSVVTEPMQIPFEFKDFFPPDFFGDQQQRVQTGAGSGFIIRSDGYILTNEHVVRNAQKLKVTLSSLYGGKKYDGQVVGADPQTDLAVVKINAKNLPTVEMGESDELIPGEWVVAIGNPYGLHDTITAGIISALGRSLEDPEAHGNLIQTDAAINPGNSGGPLVDLSGKVIGINEAIIANAQGLGFAIPINLAKNVSKELIAKGKVSRAETAWLGVGVSEIPDQVASYYNLANKDGALVQIYPDGPAAKAGLQDGDIIKEVNHQKIKGPNDVSNLIKGYKVGQEIELLIYRESRIKLIKVKLEARPQQLDSSNQRNQPLTPFGG